MNIYERILKLLASVLKMTMDGGALDREKIVVALQFIVDKTVSFVIRIPVNRNRTPEETLSATGCKLLVDDSVVKWMPKGLDHGEKEADVIFFNPGYFLKTYEDWEKEYGMRGLIPSYPYELAAVNELDPAFGHRYRTITAWRDAGGKMCFLAFVCREGQRRLHVGHEILSTSSDWLYAGRRLKKPQF